MPTGEHMKKSLFIFLITIFFALCSHVALAAQTIKIGALYNMSGPMMSIDTPSLNGARLKAKLINGSGGLLNGRKIEILALDTETNIDICAQKAAEILQFNIVAGIGYGDPAYVLPVAPLFQERGIPFVTPGATLPTLPKLIGDYMFMVPFGDDDQAYAIADFTMRTLDAHKIAIWTNVDMDFTVTLAAYFKERALSHGGEIVLEDSFHSGDVDFSGQVARLNASDAQAVFIASVPGEAGLTVKQIREAGLALPIVSGDGFDTELVASVPGPDLANNVFFSTHTFRGDHRAEVLDFINAYKQEYGREPESAFAALGFDAVGLIADALERADSDDPRLLREALARTRDYKGVTGIVNYTRDSGVPFKGVSIIGVRNGQYTVEEIWYPAFPLVIQQ